MAGAAARAGTEWEPVTASEPYVKFPKALYDALLASPMPGTHKLVAFAVVRRTIGHYDQQEGARLGVSLLARMTHRDRSQVKRARQALIREAVLVEVKAPNYSDPAVLRLNPDSAAWGRYSVNLGVGVKNTQGAKSTQGAEVLPGRGEKTPRVGANSPQGVGANSPPLKNHEDPIEERLNGRTPADDLGGSSGVGLSDEEGELTVEEALRLREQQQADIAALGSPARIRR